MPNTDERSASEVYAIIEEPTAQMSRFKALLHKFFAPFAGQMLPGSTHPAVVEKATGKRVHGGDVALTSMIGDMQDDLWKMTAGEFRRRYLDG